MVDRKISEEKIHQKVSPKQDFRGSIMKKLMWRVVLGCAYMFGVSNVLAQAVTTEMLAQSELDEKEDSPPKGTPEEDDEKRIAAEINQEGPSKLEAGARRIITLEHAQRMAAQINPNMKNSDESIIQADVFILSAWSMLLPNISGNASITRNQREIGFPFQDQNGNVEEIVVQDLWNRSLGFSVNMALFNPRSIPAIKMAYDDTDRTRLQAQMQKNDLLFKVTSTYYQIHSIKELIGVYETNLNTAKEFQKRSEAQKRAGQSTNIDVLRAQIEVMDAERNLENAKDSYEMAKTALAYLIGQEGDFEIEGPSKVDVETGNVEEVKKQALAKRAEIQAAEITKRIADRGEIEVWMRWLPSFEVTYNWSWNSAGGFAGENDSWMLIFGAKWSLLEGGSRISEIQKKKSMTRVAENEIENLKLRIREEVDTSFMELKKRKRNLEFGQKQVALAEENHHLVNRQYQVGLVTSLDVVAASSELAAKRINQVIERLEYDIAVLNLKKNAGEYHSLSLVQRKNGS